VPLVKNQMEDPINLFYRILVVGDPGVGKTSIINYCDNNIFDTTNGTIKWDENTTITMQLIDLTSKLDIDLHGNIDAALIIGDITDSENMGESVIQWKKTVNHSFRLNHIPVVMLLNKLDKIADLFNLNEVSNAIDFFCCKYEFAAWIMTSATTGSGTKIAIQELVKSIKGFNKIDRIEHDSERYFDQQPKHHSRRHKKFRSKRHFDYPDYPNYLDGPNYRDGRDYQDYRNDPDHLDHSSDDCCRFEMADMA